MIFEVSPNTQAVLLLTAPLIAGKSTSAPDVLSPGEYNRLARLLRDLQRQPADLIAADAGDVIRACRTVVDEGRLQRLLGRGFLLSQVVERWRARAIWVISRADGGYPRRLKARLREEAPAVLYGCGDARLLDRGGLAVVGSRHITDDLIDYTLAVGRLAARAGRTIVSGGAKGVDRSAMRGSLEAGGSACGVLADNLEEAAMHREHRDALLEGRLTLLSRYDPRSGFNVGHAMQRNKLIYALADAALVVNSDLNKGGTWTGALEQLERLRLVPVFVRSTGEASDGLAALQQRGALAWPEPGDAAAFNTVLDTLPVAAEREPTLPLAASEPAVATVREQQLALTVDGQLAPHATAESSVIDTASELSTSPPQTRESHSSADSSSTSDSDETADANVRTVSAISPDEAGPAGSVIAIVRKVVLELLSEPMTEVEIAAALEVSVSQARAWLQRFVKEGTLDVRSRPVRYVLHTQAQSQSPLLAADTETDRPEVRRTGTRRR